MLAQVDKLRLEGDVRVVFYIHRFLSVRFRLPDC